MEPIFYFSSDQRSSTNQYTGIVLCNLLASDAVGKISVENNGEEHHVLTNRYVWAFTYLVPVEDLFLIYVYLFYHFLLRLFHTINSKLYSTRDLYFQFCCIDCADIFLCILYGYMLASSNACRRASCMLMFS